MNLTLRTLTTSTSILATAAFSGLLAGCGSGSNPPAPDTGTQANSTDLDKHACKGLNQCKGHGGCKTAQNDCKGQNSCKGKGNCKTV